MLPSLGAQGKETIMQQTIHSGWLAVYRAAVLCLLVIGAASLPLFGQTSEITSEDSDTAERVAERTYDLSVSQGFASPPFEPFHDCLRFTKTTITTDLCGDTGSFSEIRLARNSIWQGTVPCGGLNLRFTGISTAGPEIPVLGGVAVGFSEQTNFGIEGVENPSCSTSTFTPRPGGSPYAKGK